MKNVVLFILFISQFSIAQGNAIFEQANKSYEAKQYNEAIDGYTRLIKSNTIVAPEVYYNLANAYYNTEKVAPSIYYYEKAKALQPDDKTIQDNLKLAQRMRIDHFDQIAAPFLTKVQDVLTAFFSVDIWASISIGFILLFLVFFILYFLKRKQTYFIAFTISLFFAIYSFFSANYQIHKAANNQYAIVFDKEIPLQKEAKLTADEIVKIHEGTKIKIKAQNKDWTEVQLSDGREGWVTTSSFKKL